MLELILGQIPEAIFFSLFMIYAKGIKEKRVLFTVLMVVEYLLLKYNFKYSWLFQIAYMIITFLTLKLLYRNKSQIIDIFTFTIANIILIISSALCFYICFQNVVIATLVNRILIFSLIFLLKNKLINIKKFYKKIWNRETNTIKIKTTTFRSINIIILNFVFYIINLGMCYATYYNIFIK